ncbi:MAG TPA: ferrochelatase [Pyrinomonadaceae bacterium]|nr:ferrochelatase [Pyrinomonadaceae bacterium]
MTQEKIGVVLLNLGGPDTLDAVEPFLNNLFNDPDIIDFPGSFLIRRWLAKQISTRRAPKVAEQYKKIGGGSPLKVHTLKQAEFLEAKLNQHFPAQVYTAMRYWKPFTQDALDEIERDGIKRVVLLPLYPQFSKATTESSLKEWKRQLQQRPQLNLDWTLVEKYHDFPPYINAFVERIEQGLEKFPEEKREQVHIVFSAHGTPMKLVRQGDPYSLQIAETVNKVIDQGGFSHEWSLCYQSKVGPQKWLTPSTPDMIEDLAGRGIKDMLIVPIAFASDHLETLFELGIEYRKLADKFGVEQYEVTEGLNDSAKFIDALAQLVLAEVGQSETATGAA